MTGWEFCGGFWWIFPLVMIVLCLLMMRGRRGPMMCGFGSRWGGYDRGPAGDSARDILDKRYARGEIDRNEYEEKSRMLNNESNSHSS